MLKMIVSGGQTGVDRAALDAAQAFGIACGGWCPRGRRAADGLIPSAYPLQETESADYTERTRLNVRDSDGTLVLNRGPLAGGTAYTVEIAEKTGKPCLVCDPRSPSSLREAGSWLDEHGIRRLNVAGPRERESGEIYREARAWLEGLLRR